MTNEQIKSILLSRGNFKPKPSLLHNKYGNNQTSQTSQRSDDQPDLFEVMR